jgi:hypothetical protein
MIDMPKAFPAEFRRDVVAGACRLERDARDLPKV